MGTKWIHELLMVLDWGNPGLIERETGGGGNHPSLETVLHF